MVIDRFFYEKLDLVQKRLRTVTWTSWIGFLCGLVALALTSASMIMMWYSYEMEYESKEYLRYEFYLTKMNLQLKVSGVDVFGGEIEIDNFGKYQDAGNAVTRILAIAIALQVMAVVYQVLHFSKSLPHVKLHERRVQRWTYTVLYIGSWMCIALSLVVVLLILNLETSEDEEAQGAEYTETFPGLYAIGAAMVLQIIAAVLAPAQLGGIPEHHDTGSRIGDKVSELTPLNDALPPHPPPHLSPSSATTKEISGVESSDVDWVYGEVTIIDSYFTEEDPRLYATNSDTELTTKDPKSKLSDKHTLGIHMLSYLALILLFCSCNLPWYNGTGHSVFGSGCFTAQSPLGSHAQIAGLESTQSPTAHESIISHCPPRSVQLFFTTERVCRASNYLCRDYDLKDDLSGQDYYSAGLAVQVLFGFSLGFGVIAAFLSPWYFINRIFPTSIREDYLLQVTSTVCMLSTMMVIIYGCLAGLSSQDKLPATETDTGLIWYMGWGWYFVIFSIVFYIPVIVMELRYVVIVSDGTA